MKRNFILTSLFFLLCSCAHHPRNLYQGHYHTQIHQFLQNENYLEVEPNYAILDSIIDEAKAKITLKKQYLRQDITKIFNTIDEILLGRKYLYDRNLPFMYLALNPIKMSPQILKEQIRRPTEHIAKEAMAKGEMVYTANCKSYSYFYLAIAEALDLPIVPVITPPLKTENQDAHMFVRWLYSDKDYFNWETTAAAFISDQQLLSKIRPGYYNQLTELTKEDWMVLELENISINLLSKQEFYTLDSFFDEQDKKILEKSPFLLLMKELASVEGDLRWATEMVETYVKENPPKTLKDYKMQIVLLIAVRRNENAAELLNTALGLDPEDIQLLDIKQKI